LCGIPTCSAAWPEGEKCWEQTNGAYSGKGTAQGGPSMRHDGGAQHANGARLPWGEGSTWWGDAPGYGERKGDGGGGANGLASQYKGPELPPVGVSKALQSRWCRHPAAGKAVQVRVARLGGASERWRHAKTVWQ